MNMAAVETNGYRFHCHLFGCQEISASGPRHGRSPYCRIGAAVPVEMCALPALLHGEAVRVDMALTTVMARRRGLLSPAQCERVFAVMSALELPGFRPLLGPEVPALALQDTVRHRDGRQRLPLPVGIGGVTFVNDVTRQELEEAVALQRTLGDARAGSAGG